MDLAIRAAQSAEVLQCASLIAKAYNQMVGNYALVDADTLTPLVDSLNYMVDCRNQLYSVWQNDILVGCFCLEQRDVGVYELSKFAVHPDFQNQGIGQAMLKNALDQLSARQAIAVVCVTFEHCPFVKRWLLDRGFYEVVVGNAEGIPYTFCLMRKEVESCCSVDCSGCSKSENCGV